jgi:hypothetical protein
MTWRRHLNKKTEGPEAPGKVAPEGSEQRWNNCFYPLFLLNKQIANGCFLLYFVYIQH